MTREPWFRRWFGEEYLALYPHRDEAEARDAVELLLSRLSHHGAMPTPEPGTGRGRVLDLACGAGRHLKALLERGIPAVGLDLSMELLQEAADIRSDPPLVRGDMRRLPFASASFDVVTSFFTSFGYFETEEEDRRVLGEIRRVIRPGGHVLLDFLNAPRVRSELRKRDSRRIGEREVTQERRLVEEGRRVEKRIRIHAPDGGEPSEFTERVRLYEAGELVHLLAESGYRTLELLGDYRGHQHSPDSPRAILLARIS